MKAPKRVYYTSKYDKEKIQPLVGWILQDLKVEQPNNSIAVFNPGTRNVHYPYKDEIFYSIDELVTYMIDHENTRHKRTLEFIKDRSRAIVDSEIEEGVRSYE